MVSSLFSPQVVEHSRCGCITVLSRITSVFAIIYAPLYPWLPCCVYKGGTERCYMSAAETNINRCSQVPFPQVVLLYPLSEQSSIEEISLAPTIQPPFPRSTSCTHQTAKSIQGQKLVFSQVWRIFWASVSPVGLERGSIHSCDGRKPGGQLGCSRLWPSKAGGLHLLRSPPNGFFRPRVRRMVSPQQLTPTRPPTERLHFLLAINAKVPKHPPPSAWFRTAPIEALL